MKLTKAQENMMYDIRHTKREKDGTVILAGKNYRVLKTLERKGLITITKHWYYINIIKVLEKGE